MRSFRMRAFTRSVATGPHRTLQIQLIKLYQVPSLPVHDSLLVPVSAIHLAMDALKDSYRYHCKIEPRVKIKPEKWAI
jgi:hypothetical protein